MPKALLRFDASAVPAHLTPQLTVTLDGREIARGTDLPRLRRECAVAGRLELERHARAAYGLIGHWRRFELDQLPERVPLTLPQGAVAVYPALEKCESGLQVRYEWSAEEAAAGLAGRIGASGAGDAGAPGARSGQIRRRIPSRCC